MDRFKDGNGALTVMAAPTTGKIDAQDLEPAAWALQRGHGRWGGGHARTHARRRGQGAGACSVSLEPGGDTCDRKPAVNRDTQL
jgi:hypothetical protein